MPETIVENLNLKRRAGPGALARWIAPLLRPGLFLLKKRAVPGAPPTVFESYMVGDFFMALPALRELASAGPVQVVCRPDCLGFLRDEDIPGIPFENAFRVRPGVVSFLSTWRSAWKLRGRMGAVALDLDADPRTAFWLTVGGAPRTVSYRRASGLLFDETFPLENPSTHQADRDRRVAEAFLRGHSTGAVAPVVRANNYSPPTDAPSSPSAPWILSCWTRKPGKNWPLDRWEALLEKMLAEGVPFIVLDAPDGDAEYRRFRERWSARARFLAGSLPEIAEAVRGSAGVAATDNFLGHMAGYYGKPVLWINFRSPAAQVQPRGPLTHPVQPEDGNPSSLTPDAVWREFTALRKAAESLS